MYNVHFLTIFILFTTADARPNDNERYCARRYHFMVSLRVENKHVCGGSLVSPRWVLTAAHCYPDKYAKPMKAFIGHGGSIQKDIRKFIVHPDYDNDHSNDIGLVSLRAYIGEVKPVKLPAAPLEEHMYEYCHTSTIFSWHLADRHYACSAYLMNIQHPKDCQKPYKKYTDRIICVINHFKQDCFNDTGGALMCGDFQIGIVSKPISCDKKLRLAVNTAVDKYLDWIWDTIKNTSPYKEKRQIQPKAEAGCKGLYGMTALLFLVLIDFVL